MGENRVKHGRALTLLFILFLFAVYSPSTVPVLSQGNANHTIQTQGQVIYATNLAEGAGSWEPFPYGLSYVAFEGDGSIRLDSTASNDRATWLTSRYSVAVGQRVVARSLIKTASLPSNYTPPEPWSNGARIGIDFYNANGVVVRSIALTGIDGYGPWVGGGWVPWGSGWVFKELDSPDTIIKPGEVEAIMWIQAMAHDAPASAWFKNTEFYILNPGEYPPSPIPS